MWFYVNSKDLILLVLRLPWQALYSLSLFSYSTANFYQAFFYLKMRLHLHRDQGLYPNTGLLYLAKLSGLSNLWGGPLSEGWQMGNEAKKEEQGRVAGRRERLENGLDSLWPLLRRGAASSQKHLAAVCIVIDVFSVQGILGTVTDDCGVISSPWCTETQQDLHIHAGKSPPPWSRRAYRRLALPANSRWWSTWWGRYLILHEPFL